MTNGVAGAPRTNYKLAITHMSKIFELSAKVESIGEALEILNEARAEINYGKREGKNWQIFDSEEIENNDDEPTKDDNAPEKKDDEQLNNKPLQDQQTPDAITTTAPTTQDTGEKKPFWKL